MNISEIKIGSPPENWRELIDNEKGIFVKKNIAFAVLRNDKTVRCYTGQPCHGALSSTKGYVVATSIVALRRDDEKARLFLDWFTKESYASRFILNAETYFSDGYVAVNGQMNFPLMNTLNIVLRSIYEKAFQYEAFAELTKSGVPHLVAFYVAFGTYYGYYQKSENYRILFQTSHCPISRLNLKSLKNFFSGTVKDTRIDNESLFFTKSGNYYGGINVWDEGPSTSFGWMEEIFKGSFRDKVYESRGIAPQGKAFSNPFAKRTGNGVPHTYTKDEFTSFVIPLLTEIYHECQQVSVSSLEKNND